MTRKVGIASSGVSEDANQIRTSASRLGKTVDAGFQNLSFFS